MTHTNFTVEEITKVKKRKKQKIEFERERKRGCAKKQIVNINNSFFKEKKCKCLNLCRTSAAQLNLCVFSSVDRH